MPGTIGSNFDVTGIVAELMKRESRHLNKLNEDEAAQEVKLSIYGQFKSVIEAFKQNIDKIKQAFDTVAYKITSTNETVIKSDIISNDNVFPGKHDIVISQLAKAESRIGVNTFSSKSDALSMTGNLGFTVNGETFSVAITADDSLEKIRDRINSSVENNGITANIMATTDGSGNDEYSLVISSNKTGTDNAVVISGSLESSFDFSEELSVAQNAEFTFNGKNVIRDSNEINDVIDGISFSLLNTGTASINVTENNSNRNEEIKKSIQDMVNSYNQVVNFIDQVVGNKSLTDSTVSLLKTRIKNMMDESFSGSGNILSILDLGIKSSKPVSLKTADGKSYTSIGRLEIDNDKLQKAIAENNANVKSFLLGSNNFVVNADEEIEKIVGYGGAIYERTSNINEYISTLNHQIGNEEVKLDVIKAQLTKKYAALGAIMDKFDQLSSYLESTFSNMTMGNSKK